MCLGTYCHAWLNESERNEKRDGDHIYCENLRKQCAVNRRRETHNIYVHTVKKNTRARSNRCDGKDIHILCTQHTLGTYECTQTNAAAVADISRATFLAADGTIRRRNEYVYVDNLLNGLRLGASAV